MTIRIFLLLSLLLVQACGSHQKSPKDTRITDFVQEQTQNLDSTPEHAAYKESYVAYLNDVNNLLHSPQQLDLYLASLKSNSEELEKFSNNLPKKYSKEKNKRTGIKDFQLYKTKMMTQYYDELNEARSQKLKTELGNETFQKLVEINNQYNQEKEAPGFFFPL